MSSPERSDSNPSTHGTRAPHATFESLYAQCAPALFAWAELRIRPSLRGRLEPQDLVQEVWLRGQRSFERFDATSTSFRAWAFRIGKNILMEAIRASRNEAHPANGWSTTTGTLALEGVPESVTSFTQRLAREESVRAFLQHAGELEEQDRMLLIHCGLEDETCAQAALKLGLTEAAAIKRWQRLKARLRERPWARALLGEDAGADAGPDAGAGGGEGAPEA